MTRLLLTVYTEVLDAAQLGFSCTACTSVLLTSCQSMMQAQALAAELLEQCSWAILMQRSSRQPASTEIPGFSAFVRRSSLLASEAKPNETRALGLGELISMRFNLRRQSLRVRARHRVANASEVAPPKWEDSLRFPLETTPKRVPRKRKHTHGSMELQNNFCEL